MRTRLPTTLWKHTLVELWRVLALTTAILVAVIAFALAVQLMAAGKIGPSDVPRLMLLATVPMLQYALPFAAGFSATITYHRMAQDLEVTACAAGGVSHRSLLVPAAISGLLLSGGLVALNEQVIPRFLRGIEEMVTDDAMKLMVKSFERGDAVAQGDLMIAADRVFERPPPEGADHYLILERVVALQLGDGGKVESEAQAELAHVWYYRDRPIEGEGTIVMRMEGVVGNAEDEGYIETGDVELAWRLPDAFSDDPKFLTFGELRRLRDEPRRMSFVEQRRRALAVHLGARRSLESLERAFRGEGAASLADETGRIVRIRARAIRYDPGQNTWMFVAAPGRPITAEWAPDPTTGAAPIFEAERATLNVRLGTDRKSRELSFDLTLQDYTARSGASDAENSGTLAARTWNGVTIRPNPMPELMDLSSADLLAAAAPRVEVATPDPFMAPPYRDLEKRLAKLSREITSKQHERMAMAAACLVMVLTGAVMAMRLANALPLTVYLWSFFPALAAVITISSGQQIVHKSGAIGLPLLWGGVIGLAAYTLVAFRGLARH
ncbi:MAG: LptF/LptG family permease [Planctomycetota bacterium]